MKKSSRAFLIPSIFLFISIFASAQDTPALDRWQWLIGEWRGEDSHGEAMGTATFSCDLDKNVIIRKNHTFFPATDKSKAVTHDDILIIYGDFSKAIYFDNEGHVINYTVNYSDGNIVLTSEKAENSPFFRLTYTAVGENKAKVGFAISQDGATYQSYLEGITVKK